MPARKSSAERDAATNKRARVVEILSRHYDSPRSLAAAARVGEYSNRDSKVRAWLSRGAVPGEPYRAELERDLIRRSPEDGAQLAALYAELAQPSVSYPRSELRGGQLVGTVPRAPRSFAARPHALDQLAEQLRVMDRRPVAALVGTGGVGKSSIAAQFVQLHSELFDVIWWADAPDPHSLTAALATLAHAAGVSDIDAPDHVAAAAARRFLASVGRWLIVIDGAQVRDDLLPQLPAGGAGLTVVTSQRLGWGSAALEIPVDPLDPTPGASFLASRTGVDVSSESDAQSVLADVVRRLGGLPLALEQAAAFVQRQRGMSFADYSALLDDRGLEALPSDTRPVDYAHTVSTVWDLSMAAAAAELAATRPLLSLLGMLAPTPIPDKLLARLADGDDAAADVLCGYSLVRRVPEGVTVHSLTQEVIRSRLTPSEADALVVQVSGGLLDTISSDNSNWKQFELSRRLEAHAAALLERTITRPETAGSVAQAMSRVASVARSRGDLEYARAAGLRLLAFAQKHLASEAQVLQIRMGLASTLWAMGAYDDAAAEYLSIDNDARSLSLPSEHRADIAGAAAAAMYALERYEDSLEYAQLALRYNADSPDASDTQRIAQMSNALLARTKMGERTSAEWSVLLDEARQVLEEDHNHVLTVQHNLAIALENEGSLEEAELVYSDVVRRSSDTLGPGHHSTVYTLNALLALRERIAATTSE